MLQLAVISLVAACDNWGQAAPAPLLNNPVTPDVPSRTGTTLQALWAVLGKILGKPA